MFFLFCCSGGWNACVVDGGWGGVVRIFRPPPWSRRGGSRLRDSREFLSTTVLVDAFDTPNFRHWSFPDLLNKKNTQAARACSGLMYRGRVLVTLLTLVTLVTLVTLILLISFISLILLISLILHILLILLILLITLICGVP